jgi:outer membrane protein assembly factor BamB
MAQGAYMRLQGWLTIGFAWGVAAALAACAASSAPPAKSQQPPAVGLPPAAELAALRPESVAPATWQALTSALAEAVQARNPSLKLYDATGEVLDLRVTFDAAGQPRAAWTHRPPAGDYNLDGLVNISDLTPLAANLGRSIYSHNSEWPQIRHIDGDGNNLINISDVSVLGRNFGRSNDGYEVQRAAQAAGPWTLALRVDSRLAVPNPPLPFETLSTTLPDAQAGEFYRVVPFTGRGGQPGFYGPASNIVQLLGSQTAADAWRMDGGDVSHSSFVTGTGPAAARLRWRYDMSDLRSGHQASLLGGAPLIAADGTVYIGSNEGLIALAPDGTRKWNFSLTTQEGVQAYWGALGPDGSIYVPLYKGVNGDAILQIKPDGTVGWSVPIAGNADGPLTIDGTGQIYVHTETELVCLSPAGAQLWAAVVGDHSAVGSAALAADGTAYVLHKDTAYGEGVLVSVSPAGAINWREPLPELRAQQVAVRHDGVLVVVGDFGVRAIDTGGNEAWAHEFSEANTSVRVAIDPQDNIYLGTELDIVSYAPDGTERWRTTVPGSGHINNAGRAPLLDSSGHLYTCDYKGELHCLSTNGDLLWSFDPRIPGANITNAAELALSSTGALYQHCQGELLCWADDGHGPPLPPTNVNASKGADPDYVQLRWSAAPTATGYRVYRDGALIAELGDVLQYADFGVPEGLPHGYAVSGVSFVGEGQPSPVRTGSIALPALTTGGPGGWAGTSGGPRHARRSPGRVPEQPTLQWSRQLGTTAVSAPICDAQGRLYVTYGAELSGQPVALLEALSPDGQRLWRYSPGTACTAPGMGADGTLYVGATRDDPQGAHLGFERSGQVVALGQNRTVLWQRQYPEPIIECSVDDAVAALNDLGDIYALNTDGSERWTYRFPWSEFEAPLVLWHAEPVHASTGNLYYNISPGLGSTRFVALNADGSEQWTTTMGFATLAAPMVLGNDVPLLRIYQLTAFDSAGEVLWQIPSDNLYANAAEAGDGRLLVVTKDKLSSYSAAGVIEWQRSLPGGFSRGALVDADGRAYALNNAGQLYCVSPNGQPLWSLDTGIVPGPDFSVGDDGTLYIPTVDGRLLAYGR